MCKTSLVDKPLVPIHTIFTVVPVMIQTLVLSFQGVEMFLKQVTGLSKLMLAEEHFFQA